MDSKEGGQRVYKRKIVNESGVPTTSKYNGHLEGAVAQLKIKP
jgi:hypothetical protein